MKAFTLALLLGTLTACGSAKNGDNQEVLASTPSSMLFSRDYRPVDGDLKEINLVKKENGKYDVTLRTAFYDRIHGKTIDSTTNIALALVCDFTRTATGEVSIIVCSIDNRPVDGALEEITIKRNADRSFKALLKTAYFNHNTGLAVDETTVIADNLKMK